MDGMTVEALRAFIADRFPQTDALIDAAGSGRAVVRQRIDHRHLRPGDTVSGPTMMGLADYATYVALLSAIGPVALAVTTNLTISFMHKPAADRDLLAEAVLLKLGRRLAVAEVRLTSQGSDALVAHATVTYSIPPARD